MFLNLRDDELRERAAGIERGPVGLPQHEGLVLQRGGGREGGREGEGEEREGRGRERDFMMLMYNTRHSVFQIWKLTASTTVGCMISLPGKTPQVTAMGWEGSQLVRFSVPCGRWGRSYKNVKILWYMHMWLNVHDQVNNIHCTCSSTTTNTSRVACRVPGDITGQWSSLKHAIKSTEISSSGSSSGRGESLLEL